MHKPYINVSYGLLVAVLRVCGYPGGMLKKGQAFQPIDRLYRNRDGGKMDHDETLDAVGMMCPMPIVELSKKMKELAPGTVLEIRADDEGVVEDIPSWCNRTGNEFLGIEEEGDVYVSYVRKG